MVYFNRKRAKMVTRVEIFHSNSCLETIFDKTMQPRDLNFGRSCSPPASFTNGTAFQAFAKRQVPFFSIFRDTTNTNFEVSGKRKPRQSRKVPYSVLHKAPAKSPLRSSLR